MRRDVVYAALACFAAVISLAVAGILYTNHVASQSEHHDQERARQICGLIVVLDDAYRQTPPTTEVGRHVAAELHTYRVGLGC